MSREILFRAWHEEHEQMVYFWPEKLKNDQYQAHHLAKLMAGDYGDMLMQYTGTLGLYEGDIVKDHNGVGVIEYSKKFAAFKVVYSDDENKGSAKWFYDYLHSEWGSIVCIGNVHEGVE